MGILAKVAALMGIAGYAQKSRQLSSGAAAESLDEAREKGIEGSNIVPQMVSRSRYIQRDVERAESLADAGDLLLAGQMMRAAQGDAVYRGVLSTRTDGLVCLPKRYSGYEPATDALRLGSIATRSLFDEMCPSAEVARLAADGIELGVGVAEIVSVPFRDHPLMIRLPPEFLIYRRYENTWYYRTNVGLVPINPGDGKWVLHMPGGRESPWQNGIWKSIARAWVRKDNAEAHSDNWESKLANAARVALAPAGASEEQRINWFQKVMAWGKNTVFSLSPGYDVKLLESNGRGHESFEKTVARKNEEMIIAVAGQTVTTDGGAGFQNSDIHKSIRADLIKSTAESIAETINTQVLPHWFVAQFGEENLDKGVTVDWDVTPPKDRNAEAQAMMTVAQAVDQMTRALAMHGLELDVRMTLERFGVPIKTGTERKPMIGIAFEQAYKLAQDRNMRVTENSVIDMAERTGVELELLPAQTEDTSNATSIELAPTDVAKVVRVREARASQGLKPFDDERDDMTIEELSAKIAADREAQKIEKEAEAKTSEVPQNEGES